MTSFMGFYGFHVFFSALGKRKREEEEEKSVIFVVFNVE